MKSELNVAVEALVDDVERVVVDHDKRLGALTRDLSLTELMQLLEQIEEKIQTRIAVIMYGE